MWRKIFKQITGFALIVFLLIPTLLPKDANAQIYQGVRNMSWDSGERRCTGGGWNEITKKHTVDVLDFNPLGNNPDVNWELSNGVCAAYIASVGTTLLAIQGSSYLMCTGTNPIGAGLMATEFAEERAANSIFPTVNPGIAVTLGLRSKQCGTRSTEYATLASAGGPGSPGAIAAAADVARCCPSAISYGLTVTAAVTALAIMYGIANGAYQKARICGAYHDYGGSTPQHYPWKTWSHDSGTWKKGAYDGSYKQMVESYAASATSPSISDRKYREYIFGGVEYEDNGDHSCLMPNWSSSRLKEILGYDTSTHSNLAYYMTGPSEAPVFACYRFLLANGSDQEVSEGLKAYDCCNKRSQNTICIENTANVADTLANKYEYSFCEVGSRCAVKGVYFDAYWAETKSNYACARTYSGCPYNHPLGGGTEIADYSDPNDLSTLQNYCQYMNHCSILPIKPYVVQSSLSGAFFDSSCRDMKGDSQNTYGYSSNLVPVNLRGFSAPMAQCFKETIENLFFNRAGSTACLDPTESPTANGKCNLGYKYKKGDDLSSYQRSIGQSGKSFLVKIQDALQDTIKMALSMSIMFLGISVLIGGSGVTRKQLIPFVAKLAFVMYFATGNEWQYWVVDGIIGSSAELSDVMFRTDSLTGTATSNSADGNGVQVVKYVTDANVDQSKLDGCQFPRYNYADPNNATKYDYGAYPPGKEYLRIWDTLDCKIGRAFGYGIDVSVPNLVMMILGGFFTGGAGIIFVIATFAFAFFMIALTVRALHIFVLSVMSLVIMFYMSPIMVTLAMFSKTKGIFDKWWKQILSFALQPMILFAYMGILLTFFDTTIMGDVTFVGDGKSVPKQVVCSGAAVNTSIYCIFNPPISGTNAGVKTYEALKVLGVGLPILTSMNQTKIATLVKAAVLFFIFMSFMDKISEFANKLTGEGALPGSNTMKMTDMMTKAQGKVSDIQKRGMGMIKKNAIPAAARAVGMARQAAAYGVTGDKKAVAARDSDTGARSGSRDGDGGGDSGNRDA